MPSVDTRDARRAAIKKYARLAPSGRPCFCGPSPQEVERRQGRESRADGKVIYDTVELAEAAAKELLLLGAEHLEPYACHRSKRGHLHLRTVRRV